MSDSWVPRCAVCEVLNSVKAVAHATTSLHGVPICNSHVREAHGSDTSPAAKAVRRLLSRFACASDFPPRNRR